MKVVHINATDAHGSTGVLASQIKEKLLQAGHDCRVYAAEALACGTPCVVYNKTACPELIGEGCGYVVETYDELKKQICSVAGGGKTRFSSACRTYAETMFNMETNVKKYIEFYNRSVKK